jgi:hypothetical protein
VQRGREFGRDLVPPPRPQRSGGHAVVSTRPALGFSLRNFARREAGSTAFALPDPLDLNVRMRVEGGDAPPRHLANLRRVSASEHDESFMDRVSRQGEEALGRIAEELIANPVVNGAVARAFEARERAVQAQEAALGALNLPSAADIERVTRRLRSLSQRLEGIEDSIDRLEERLAVVAASAGQDGRLSRIEARLDEISRDVNRVRESVSPSEDPMPRAQERLTVTDS